MMQNGRFWQGVKRLYARYDRMMEKQGFYIVLAVCVMVIAASALYTFRLRDEADAPEPAPQAEAQAAAGMDGAQTLGEALVESQSAGQPVQLPTQSAFRFTQPLSGVMARAFSDTEPQHFARDDVWRVHLGVDLLAEYGAPVAACASGKVVAVVNDAEWGLCVRVDHQNGYESLYAGLSDASYVREGDPVSRGQTIGHAGNGVLAEGDEEPHLHLEARRNGVPVDPLTLFLGVDNDTNK